MRKQQTPAEMGFTHWDVKRISKELWHQEKVELLMNELYPGKNISVPDPWYGEEDGYHEVYKMISDACDAIIEKYSILNIQ